MNTQNAITSAYELITSDLNRIEANIVYPNRLIRSSYVNKIRATASLKETRKLKIEYIEKENLELMSKLNIIGKIVLFINKFKKVSLSSFDTFVN